MTTLQSAIRPAYRALGESALEGVAVTRMGEGGFLARVHPAEPALSSDLGAASDWLRTSKPALDALLLDAGAILFRGFPLSDSAAFDRFLSPYPGHESGYLGGTSNRNVVTGRVMESTVAPPDRVIPIHQEMAYSSTYPLKLAFYCELPPAVGGETPVCDMRRLTSMLPRDLADKVLTHGLNYFRHFREPEYATGVYELDVVHRTWQQSFQTTDKDEVEAQAEKMGSELSWSDNGVVLRNSSPGYAQHPETGETVWFNSIGGFSFHKRVIGEDMSGLYETHYGDRRPRPFWVDFGNGEQITFEQIESLYDVTAECTVSVPWQFGDVILIDNIYTGHGRNTFQGDRKIRVSLLN